MQALSTSNVVTSMKWHSRKYNSLWHINKPQEGLLTVQSMAKNFNDSYNRWLEITAPKYQKTSD